jgi:hypothetical protein
MYLSSNPARRRIVPIQAAEPLCVSVCRLAADTLPSLDLFISALPDSLALLDSASAFSFHFPHLALASIELQSTTPLSTLLTVTLLSRAPLSLPSFILDDISLSQPLA